MFAAKASRAGQASKSNGKNESTGQLARTDKETERSLLSSISNSGNVWTSLREDIAVNGDAQPAAELVGSGTIDEDSIYSKNERTLVAYFGPLPKKVDEALSKSDYYTQPMIAKLDLDAGFGIVVSQSKCYIWAAQKNVTYRSPPMCITLPMPPNSFQSPDKSVLLPVVAITKSEEQHAGILACSPDGTCWYWNNIDLSLSNVNQHVDLKINLAAQNDYVSHVECAGPMGYYFGTRYANIHQVCIKKQVGSITLTSTQLFGKSASTIASIFSMIGRPQGPDTTQRLVSLTSGPKVQDPYGRWDLFAITRRSLFRWYLSRSGECTMAVEVPLRDQITERILRDYSATLTPGSDPRVFMLDVEYTRNGKLLVLVSFFATDDKWAHSPLSCALFTLSTQFGNTIDIESVKYIHRTIEEDNRPEARPKLVVPYGGPGVFIILPKSVIISSTLSGSDFEDHVPLKSDRFIGIGNEDWKQRGQELWGSSELSIVCRESGRLGIHIYLDGVNSTSLPSLDDSRTPQELLTAQLQAKLEQAVFFGGKKRNPISFDLAHYDGGDLNLASLNVSKEILNSHAALLNSSKDLTARLQERYQRIRSIIESIQAAEMASRLSIDTRFQLSWSAEKLAAANTLWAQYQQKMASKNSNKAPRTNLKAVMDDAAAQSLKSLNAHTTEDPISFFLKYHVENLAELLSQLQKSARKLTVVSAGQQAELTRDINKILVLGLRSAWTYRRQNTESYALKSSSSVEPWTATEIVVKSLTAQYSATLAICQANPEETGRMEVDGKDDTNEVSDLSPELKDQLCDLADAALQAHSERLQYLEGLPPSSTNNIAIAEAVKAYDQAKSDLLTPLVELKKTQSAMQLAQRYKDFTTLVKLSIGQEKQTTEYLSTYQQEFANALFQWYYDNDQLPTLLEVGEKYSDLFTVYLDARKYSEIAWLHDIKIKRFIVASQRVHEGAIEESNVDRRRTMFSLSKLLVLAGVSQHQRQERSGQDSIDPESMMKYASKNNEELEMATIQAFVADEWEKQVGALVSIDEKAQTVVDTFKSPVLAEQTMFREALLRSARSLLNRQAISSEDLLDVLMTQQTFEIENVDVCDAALGICLHAADIPENRRPHVLQDIWRRIFISGEDELWHLEDVTDVEARERLLHSWMCRAYAVIYRAEGQKNELMLRPEDAKCTVPAELFKDRFLNVGLLEGDYQKLLDKTGGGISSQSSVDKNCEAMIQDYERENEELERRIQGGQLLQKWNRVKELVKEEATRAGGIPSLEGQNLSMEDVEMEDSFA
ncbi:hypothetical protein BGZ65_007457 [Modicella reniformis]|uniref:Nucleoporin Nup133/Nup155-like C-terminal domain-containing protein n=1 Tax=Modicella reniformis TaxID=1440133 RepID=A0A9P6MB56_9FUNG|nr:hypothetical protein BGZ65_007457 [Modicella reniformis]